MDEWIDRWVGGWTDRRMGGWIGRWLVDMCMYVCMDGWKDGAWWTPQPSGTFRSWRPLSHPLDRWMDGQMDGWVDDGWSVVDASAKWYLQILAATVTSTG